MNLQLNVALANSYKSNSQKIRVITEDWAGKNLYCPCCGNEYIRKFANNRSVADLFCPHCKEEYELKSGKGGMHNKVIDGAYSTMIERINSINNPNFFFMQYNKSDMKVENLIVVPKHFFITAIIQKRNPLAETAKRAGWVGCDIMMKEIPKEGKIFIIKEGKMLSPEMVMNKIKKTKFVADYTLESRGWIIDILNCIDQIPTTDFTLDQMYRFVGELSLRHKDNHHVKDKIRQQLQVLRDKGMIEFSGRGNYKKL